MTAPCALYRCRNRAGAVIYVGVTNNPQRREWEHKCRASFRDNLDAVDVEWFSSRAEALAAEAEILNGPLRPSGNVYGAKAGVFDASPVAALIDEWPARKEFAAAVGAPLAVVHKWARSGRIPSDWQWRVVCAAQAAGHTYADAEWMLRAHHPAASTASEAA